MGFISIIARRMTDNTVQYGYSGNGGYFKDVGYRLLEYYSTPEMVEYLFSLGELKHLGIPHSELGGCHPLLSTVLKNTPHNIGRSEREIFSRIAFIDCGYFYDKDNKWYYVIPGPIRIKIPLRLLENNLDNNEEEFDFCDTVAKNVLKNAFELSFTLPTVQEQMSALDLNSHKLKAAFLEDEYNMYRLWEKYEFVFKALDDWCVIECDDEYKNVTACKLKPKSQTHTETIEW